MTEVLEMDPVTYKIQDLGVKSLSELFYESELVRFDKQDEVSG